MNINFTSNTVTSYCCKIKLWILTQFDICSVSLNLQTFWHQISTTFECTIRIARWKRFKIYKNAFFYFQFCYLFISTRRSVFFTLAQKTNACISILCLNTLYQSELACSFNPRNSRARLFGFDHRRSFSRLASLTLFRACRSNGRTISICSLAPYF